MSTTMAASWRDDDAVPDFGDEAITYEEVVDERSIAEAAADATKGKKSDPYAHLKSVQTKSLTQVLDATDLSYLKHVVLTAKTAAARNQAVSLLTAKIPAADRHRFIPLIGDGSAVPRPYAPTVPCSMISGARPAAARAKLLNEAFPVTSNRPVKVTITIGHDQFVVNTASGFNPSSGPALKACGVMAHLTWELGTAALEIDALDRTPDQEKWIRMSEFIAPASGTVNQKFCSNGSLFGNLVKFRDARLAVEEHRKQGSVSDALVPMTYKQAARILHLEPLDSGQRGIFRTDDVDIVNANELRLRQQKSSPGPIVKSLEKQMSEAQADPEYINDVVQSVVIAGYRMLADFVNDGRAFPIWVTSKTIKAKNEIIARRGKGNVSEFEAIFKSTPHYLPESRFYFSANSWFRLFMNDAKTHTPSFRLSDRMRGLADGSAYCEAHATIGIFVTIELVQLLQGVIEYAPKGERWWIAFVYGDDSLLVVGDEHGNFWVFEFDCRKMDQSYRTVDRNLFDAVIGTMFVQPDFRRQTRLAQIQREWVDGWVSTPWLPHQVQVKGALSGCTSVTEANTLRVGGVFEQVLNTEGFIEELAAGAGDAQAVTDACNEFIVKCGYYGLRLEAQSVRSQTFDGVTYLGQSIAWHPVSKFTYFPASSMLATLSYRLADCTMPTNAYLASCIMSMMVLQVHSQAAFEFLQLCAGSLEVSLVAVEDLDVGVDLPSDLFLGWTRVSEINRVELLERLERCRHVPKPRVLPSVFVEAPSEVLEVRAPLYHRTTTVATERDQQVLANSVPIRTATGIERSPFSNDTSTAGGQAGLKIKLKKMVRREQKEKARIEKKKQLTRATEDEARRVAAAVPKAVVATVSKSAVTNMLPTNVLGSIERQLAGTPDAGFEAGPSQRMKTTTGELLESNYKKAPSKAALPADEARKLAISNRKTKQIAKTADLAWELYLDEYPPAIRKQLKDTNLRGKIVSGVSQLLREKPTYIGAPRDALKLLGYLKE